MTRIHCISSPRNISTAMMYAFAQRGDTQVVDEPFYAHYLIRTGKDHPGRDEVLASQPHDKQQVMDELGAMQDKPVLFIKNMSKHLDGIDIGWFEDWVQLLLIRDPRQIIASFAKGYPDPGMDDIGLDVQLALYQFFIENNWPVVVLDCNQVLQNPRGVLSTMCDQLGIPWDAAMLSWEPGPRPEDGVWARYWYHSVHKSSGFNPPSHKKRELPASCEALYLEALPYYEQLYLHALKA